MDARERRLVAVDEERRTSGHFNKPLHEECKLFATWNANKFNNSDSDILNKYAFVTEKQKELSSAFV